MIQVDVVAWDKELQREFNIGGFADCINILAPISCVFTIDPSQEDFATMDRVRNWVATKIRAAKDFELVEDGNFIYHRPTH